MPVERFDFPSTEGHRLAARLDLPTEPVRAYALFAHCFTCGKDIHVAARIAAALAQRGIATVRFDFTGLGGSGGDFANTDFSSNTDDLKAALAHMRETGRPASLLIGHSFGGAAVLAVAGSAPEVRAVAVIAAPYDTAHIVDHFRDEVSEIERAGEAAVNLAGRPFTIRRGFLDDVRAQDQKQRIHDLGRPLLVLHSPVDQVVGVDNAREIFTAARHPKSYVSLDDADHLLTRPADAEYAAALIAQWAARYLPDAGAAPTVDPGEPGLVVVEETGQGPLQQRVTAGSHRLRADEPVAVGGGDTGPGPYDFLLSALGACTSMTLRLYAERKKLSLERVRVALRHRRIHIEDCVGCDGKDMKLEVIDREITLTGDLDAPTRARLMEIADKCPVHRTLTSKIEIRTVERTA
ncbi:MAG TPA: bifunctional alpha/beta hydrolase/OsmC family protein [Aliidongia sp.]|uniref:bifunctional alpha/beta hydrolase/OsmC family protein n=1 Tax=Aliidongia sp. TaxID=1914230 RepID=UPI002DDCD696|nr:bifunctional alpha/beta hydrolase/OsmC family protein [Aliidongia sp.]HEV2673886.1 bifunctional alpha/beta hydrolase/OsmC family protein [Aliidongia sp.]